MLTPSKELEGVVAVQSLYKAEGVPVPDDSRALDLFRKIEPEEQINIINYAVSFSFLGHA